jgi:spermidine synthase
MRTQLLLGHLPVLLLPQMPSTALVIGLGSGTTLGAIELYPLKSIDCVEIEPAVVEAARLYFADVNRNGLADPRLRLIIADGRNFVAAGSSRYDVITSEPSNLWMAGCSNLFTYEFFKSARKRLSPNGMMCQWIHLYQISANDIRIFMRTFQAVFPHVSLWIDGPDMLALGSPRPILIDPRLLALRLAEPPVFGQLNPSNLGTPHQFLPLFAAGDLMARRFADGAPLNTDDHPILEFSAPRSLLEVRFRQIVRDLLTGRPYED